MTCSDDFFSSQKQINIQIQTFKKYSEIVRIWDIIRKKLEELWATNNINKK